MDIAFKVSQHALNSIQRKVKEKLEQLQLLDKICLQLQLRVESMRESFLEELTTASFSEEKSQNNQKQLQDIAKLQQELKQTAFKKVQISQQIETLVLETCQKIDQQIYEATENSLGIPGIRQQVKSLHLEQKSKRKGKRKTFNAQVKEIIKDYYIEKESEQTLIPKQQKYCMCVSEQNLLYPGSMIQCENPQCKIGWFHFECVGLNIEQIPQHWYCKKCLQKQKKKVIKVTLDNKKFECQMRKQIVEGSIERSQSKRKRGRPKKYLDN